MLSIVLTNCFKTLVPETKRKMLQREWKERQRGRGGGAITTKLTLAKLSVYKPCLLQVTRGTEFRFTPADSLTGAEGNIGISFNATRFVFQFQSM